MYVNHSQLGAFSGQIVFKVAAFGFEASVKMSSPPLSAYLCAVSITRWSLVKFVQCRHNADRTVKVRRPLIMNNRVGLC